MQNGSTGNAHLEVFLCYIIVNTVEACENRHPWDVKMVGLAAYKNGFCTWPLKA